MHAVCPHAVCHLFLPSPYLPDPTSISPASQAMEPFFSVIFSAIFLGDIPALPVLLTLIPIVGGVVMASLAEVRVMCLDIV